MRTRLLGGDELARKWYLIVEKVERSLVHGTGDVSSYDIFIECQQFICQCWIREDEWGTIHGVAITRILTHKQYKEMVIVCTTSEGWFDHGPEIDNAPFVLSYPTLADELLTFNEDVTGGDVPSAMHQGSLYPVSYTHLTLPTNREV